MALDVADGHAARVKREDLLVEPLDATLVLFDQLRLECALAVAGDADSNGARLRLDRLLGGPGTTDINRRSSLGRSLEMLRELRLKQPFHHGPFQSGERALRTEDVFAGIHLRNELVDKLRLESFALPVRRDLRFDFLSGNGFHERLRVKSPASSTNTKFLTLPSKHAFDRRIDVEVDSLQSTLAHGGEALLDHQSLQVVHRT